MANTDNITVDNVKKFVSDLKTKYNTNIIKIKIEELLNVMNDSRPVGTKEALLGGGLDESLSITPSGGKKNKKTSDLKTKKIKKKLVKTVE